MDNLSNLHTDLLFQQLTYLPFDDVVKVCTSNRKLHSYCSDPKYNNKWRSLIDNIYRDVYKYDEELDKIWKKLNLSKGSYNYLVYTQLINLLDPLTQLMIYYLQGDIISFDNEKFNDEERFLTMFLLNKPLEMIKYKTTFYIIPYFSLLKGEIVHIDYLNKMLFRMAKNGNVRGVKYLIEKGSDIHALNDWTLQTASYNGQIDVVKYLVENGANIHAEDDNVLMKGIKGGDLNIVKYLVENGANIHAQYNLAFKLAATFKHQHILKYLVNISK